MSDFPFLQALVLEGVYSAYWVVWPMPRDNVRAMLPPGLKLGQQDITLESTHPVLLAFGQHRHARLTEFQFLFDNVTYLESSISIPFVQFAGEEQQKSSAENFLYIPRLYLNNYRAIFGGDLFWGFTKELGNINPGNQFYQTYQVNSYIFDKPITSLNFEVMGNYGKTSDFSNFSIVQVMMNQPLIMKTILGFGPYVQANYIWNFNEAIIRPIKAQVNIFQQYLPGLKPDIKYSVEGIDRVELGAFQMVNPWVLQLPSLVV